MEKITAGSYIEARIQKTRTRNSDKLALILSEVSVNSPEEDARIAAHGAQPELTASHLSRINLPISQKGVILAEAYNRDAELMESMARKYLGFDEEAAKAPQLKRIAQGLTRAAQRSQNS